MHDLRHVAATDAIAASADVKLVQLTLGHKDATETLNTYSHLWPKRVDEVIDAVERRRAEALGLARSDRLVFSHVRRMRDDVVARDVRA